MKNFLTKILFSKNPKWNSALGVLLLAAFVLACGGSSAPKKPIPEAYLGSWTAQDGTTLNIRADNTGDYNAGGSKVDGAAVEIDEAAREIKFTMGGGFVDVGKYKIDQPPSGNQMKLDGQTFRRSGGFSSSGNDETTSITNRGAKTEDDDNAAPNAEMPDDVELQSLAKTTLLDFNSAVQAEDFSSFHGSASSYFQEQFPIAKLEQTFAPFVEKKVDIGKISGMQARLKPSMEEQNGIQVLNVTGSYPTAPTTSFDLKYVQEDVDWKLLSINVRVK
jgi:hypothetical protein